MGRGLILLFWIIYISQRFIDVSGCQLQGVNPILVRVTVNILDVDRGAIYDNQIIDIASVTDVVQNPGLNSGPYIRGYISGTTFYLETTDNFAQYEEHETEASIILNAQFRCSDGTSITQVFQVNVQDTNNNSPVFLPSNEYDISIATPLLPGHLITGCQHNIVVRDIDLTTSRIDFALTGSDLFEIEYDEESSTNAKEFIAILKTSTFIRTLPEALELTISATDVDATGDPPRTSYATVRISADSEAVLPEEPVFSQPLYTATYTEDNTIILNDSISLQQGYHEDVSFSLNTEYSSYFAIIRDGNDVSLSVTTPLSAEILTRQQLYLIIRADREFTSGATATVVVQLPEEIGLLFERANYEGVIENNILTLSNLVLTQGYESAPVSVSVSNEFFSANIQVNIITLTMQPLTQEIIDANTFLNLEVTARTERSSATTVVTLEVVKDDTVTPVFQSPTYIGSYDTETGLTMGQIELTQGFDDTVEIILGGEHSSYFQLIRNGPVSTLTVESLPLEELGEQTIILTIYASKPRTVGATASIYISLPEEIRLAFQQTSYEGIIIDNTLQVPNLILTQGYENLAVVVTVSNEFFTASIQENVITLTMGQLTDAVIQENSFLNLEVTATTSRSSATTIVTLEIIKDDTITPQFENALYSGTYTVQDGLIVGQITVIQGYDETVDIALQGEYSNLFQLVRNGPSSTVTGTVPPALFSQRNIALTVTATKPRTVGSTAVINIALPTDRVLEFGANTYRGTYQNNILTLGVISLSAGYDDTVVFQLSDYNQYFEVTNVLNQVSIQQLQPLPDSIISENNFLALTLTASGLNALSTTASILIEIIKDDISTPIFSQNIYSGAYSDGRVVIQDINLIQGFDSTVSFILDGDNSEYFTLNQIENRVTLFLSSAIPEDVIFNQKSLVFSMLAEKPLTVGANAAISVTFPSELTEPAVMRFSQNTYVGSLEDGNLTIESISLSTGYAQNTQFILTGGYSSYFTLSNTNEVISITSSDTLPQEVIEENKFIVLEVEARRDRAVSVFSSVIIDLIHDESVVENPVFNAAYYQGSYDLDEGLQFTEQIYLVQGYDDTVSFELQGEHSELFSVSDNNNVITLSASALPENVWENNDQLIFSLIANKPDSQSGRAAIVIDMQKEISDGVVLGFERSNYLGSINNEVITLDPITLSEGFTDAVVFSLHGDLQSFFTLARNGATVTLQLSNTIPEDSIPSNGIIILEVQASTTTDALPAITTVILEVIRETQPEVEQLLFSQTFYVGTYTTTDGLSLENTISLTDGYDDNVQFSLEGDDATYFGISQSGNSLSLTLNTAIPPAVIANNNQLIFEISAQSDAGATARATIVITLPNEYSDNVILGFERTNYLGSINNEVITLDPITLSEGFTDAVIFSLHGDLQSFFTLARNGATVTLELSNTIPEDSVPSNGIIVLEVQASMTTDALPAVTTVILEVIREMRPEVDELVFSQTFYFGTYTTADGLSLESTISLAEGYDDNIQFILEGDNAIYFEISQSGNSVSLTLATAIPPAVIVNNNQLVFVINAQSSGATARATIIINLPNEYTERDILGFERTSYVGSITNGAVDIEPIILTEGYTAEVTFSLYGELESYFGLSRNGATVIVQLQTSIPEELVPANGIIILGIQASTGDALPAVATIVLEVERLDGGPTVTFSKVLYEGLMQADTVEHETITVTGYDETTTVAIRGVYSELFTASLVEGIVTVQRTGSVALPTDVTHVAVEIHIGDGAAVLLLQVVHTDTPTPLPTITFSSSNYEVRAEVLQTGLIGRVSATADNGESLVYSVIVEDAHLAARLSVNNDGELVLSSPANSGEYIFQVLATTRITQATGTATVYLTVDETSIVMPPLIVLDRDEEETHENLVEFSSSDCTYTLTNRFPANQDWLYVNETGLHARVIDREDPSIAFMALSQVQVELEVHCNSLTRNKRSVRESRLDWLGPYDYGTSNWILGESIEYNPTKSVVNLIVNDINDNAPIFVGKDNEPIAVGYPVPELEDVVLPRALAELQATDADVGENAALVYWSAEPVLAVSPTSGFVHVRDGATLEEDQTLVVHATDRNGQGLSASINLVVKLLDESNIAVVTIRDAFLDDEPIILANLTSLLGYEVKVLRAVVISDEIESIQENIGARKKRQTSGSGATLELYVYGLVQREPVAVEILTEDININAIEAISVASTISLRDHLEARQISSGRDVGLLVATIVLSILLFILIVAILVWFFLKWRKERNYEEFSDENSLESRNESIGQPPKVDIRPKPRIDIDELKRSERRLREMIDAPYNDVVTPTTSTVAPVESIIDISQPDPNILIPIVINDKLKDADEEPSDVDEFGEIPRPRRKSVVTFNENVERIIHVDDNVDASSASSDIEVFRL